MSTIFGTAENCYMLTTFDGADAGGIKVEGIDFAWAVASTYGFGRRETKYVQRCFGKNFVYGFGQDIGELTVSGLLMLGKPGAANFGAFEQSYMGAALTQKGSVGISFPAAGHVVRAFLLNLDIETQAVEYNLHAFKFGFMVLDMPGGGGAGSDKGDQATKDTAANEGTGPNSEQFGKYSGMGADQRAAALRADAKSKYGGFATIASASASNSAAFKGVSSKSLTGVKFST